MASQPYRPANATEGNDFERNWCAHCLCDKVADWEDEFGNDIPGACPIRDIAQYAAPPEWTYRHGMPWCTAFEEDQQNPARCLLTKEMKL